MTDRHGSPTFYQLTEEMKELHDRKSHDYASNENPFGNYEFAGKMACMFSYSPPDAGFFGRICEKIYRIINLESGGKIPNNESLVETERDIAVITTLWMAYRRDRRRRLKSEELDSLEPGAVISKEGVEYQELMRRTYPQSADEFAKDRAKDAVRQMDKVESMRELSMWLSQRIAQFDQTGYK